MYLTPDTPPGDNVWLLFHVPRDSRHIGLFVGALADLCNEYHFIREGTFSPADTAEEFCRILRDMIYYQPPEIGTFVWSMRHTTPDNWLPCEGQTLNQADWPELAEAILPPEDFDLEGTFELPNIQGRVFVPAGELVIAEGNSMTFEAQDVGGQPYVQLALDEMPAHNHSEITAVASLINGGLEAPAAAAVPGAGLTGTTGVGNGHYNMQPYIVQKCFIIARFP